MIRNPFFGKLNKNEPVIYFYEPNGTHQTVISNRNNGIWKSSISNLTLEDFINVIKIIKPVQTITESYKQYPFKHYKTICDYAQPIFCKGENLSLAKDKPKVIYNEIKGTKIEIPNMPKVQKQSELGECKFFALAALVQKYICDKYYWQMDSCEACIADKAVSFFGFMPVGWVDNNGEFVFDRENEINALDILSNMRKINDGNYYLDSCKPFYKISEPQGLGGTSGIEKSKAFREFLSDTYKRYKGQKLSNSTNDELLKIIEYFTNMERKYFDFSKAILQTTFNNFVKNLFFDGCPMSELPVFLPYFITNYPSTDYDNNFTNENMILSIRDGLMRGKPVLVQNIHHVKNIDGTTIQDGEGSKSHVLLISGYKKVVNPNDSNDKKELFKLHNSYGKEWQLEHNNGWVDAENFITSLAMYWDKDKKYLRPYDNETIWVR